MTNLHETEGWILLNEKPIMDCDERDEAKHSEENGCILDEMENRAFDEHGLWAVKRSFADAAHANERNRYSFEEPFDLYELTLSADLKNGMDHAISADGKTFYAIAMGKGYTSNGLNDVVTTVFECRLLDGKQAEAAREILDIAREYGSRRETEEKEAARAFYGETLPLR